VSKGTRTAKRPTGRGARMTDTPIATALPALLETEGLSLRALANAIGVDSSHLSRGLRAGSGRVISGELASRIAEQLALPSDYFPETRAAVVHAAISGEPALRDRIYRGLVRGRAK
jgi:transcriptional regulator with XRE-family HTH domain